MSYDWESIFPHAFYGGEPDFRVNGKSFYIVCESCQKDLAFEGDFFDLKEAGFIILVRLDSDGYLTFEDNKKVHFKDAVPILKDLNREDRRPLMDLVVLAPHQVRKKYKLEIHNLTNEAGITHTSWE
ncbi:hypothetical protein SAMN02745181_0159 [Rubritalea squalenifaciens DSM 18772]|uniref:Uncharacterized protein n=1 Tax=Rubritalea squalenifaciens DSM 18772 TaxID=1123071 RepID=A0A1M6BB29_9BACT|nr:hypothetical protein [Rubritalea squalenifaciens]SHI45653.1 hypothetical protein SAMN02745181_0159 [Rubritalea squalenifaciens DSM 18772]